MRNRCPFLFWYLTLLCVLVVSFSMLSGCASAKKAKKKKVSTAPVLVYNSENKPPSWITAIPEEKKYFYFSGTSSDTGSFDSGKKEAVNDALSQVVSTIGITVTSSSTYEERYFAEQYQIALQSELLTEGKAMLQDAEVQEIYYEKWERPDGSTFFRVWLLLKYSKDDIKKEQERLAEILRLKYGEVSKYEEEAAEYEKKDILFDAVHAHVNASAAALKLDDGEVFFDRNMIRAGKLLRRLQLRKIGEDQTGFVGEALEKPLQLKIYFLKEGREIPVPNVSVTFFYAVPKIKSAGYKKQVFHVATDTEGIAAVRIDMVYEVSDKNRVDAKIDLSSLLSQVQSAPEEYQGSIDSFEDVAGTKKTVFLFPSDTHARTIRTAVYFMQLDNNDEPLAKPVAAPAFYEVLYEKRFSIRVLDINPSSIVGRSDNEIWERLDRSAGKGVKRFLYGVIRIIEFDEISGFQTAKAQAIVVLIDRETQDIIRTWQMQRSGTGNTKEAAQLNVLTAMGKSLGERISNTMP